MCVFVYLCGALSPALLDAHPRLQWYWTPYTPQATLVVRTATSEPITPGGCWGAGTDALTTSAALIAKGASATLPPHATAATNTSCVDVSFKALTDSLSHYRARALYTEMEMFVPLDHLPSAIADFRAFQVCDVLNSLARLGASLVNALSAHLRGVLDLFCCRTRSRIATTPT
jgi:hypothetical protein